MWEKQLCRHQRQWNRRRGGAPGAGAEIPLQYADHGEAGHPPAAHGGPWWSRSPPAACAGLHTRADEYLKEVVTPWRAHAGAGLLQDLWPHRVPTLEQPVPEGLHPVEGTHAGVVCEDLQPMGRSHFGEVHRELWEGSHAGSGAECEESSPWGGKSDRDSMWRTDRNPHSQCPCAAWGEELENLGEKLSPGRKEGWGEGVFKTWFYFSLFYSNLIGNKLK